MEPIMKPGDARVIFTPWWALYLRFAKRMLLLQTKMQQELNQNCIHLLILYDLFFWYSDTMVSMTLLWWIGVSKTKKWRLVLFCSSVLLSFISLVRHLIKRTRKTKDAVWTSLKLIIVVFTVKYLGIRAYKTTSILRVVKKRNIVLHCLKRWDLSWS